MVRRHASELPGLPAEIAAAAKRAADARRTMALALAPSIDPDEFEAYRSRILASVDEGAARVAPDCPAGAVNPSEAAAPESLVARCTALADRAEQDCARAVQRAKATSDLLGRALFVALEQPPRSEAGRSSWRPSYSLVRGGK